MNDLSKGLIGAAMTASMVVGATAARGADEMKITFNWLAGAPHVGFAMAEKLGYYDDADIDVEFEEGRGSGTTSQLVATGRTDIGFADGATAMSVAANGAPIKIIAPIWQASSFAVIVLDDSGINSVGELEGRKVAVCPGCAQVALLDPLLEANGVSKSNVELVNAEGSAFLGMLAERQVDAVLSDPGLISIPLAERGIETRDMYYRDNGVSTVSLSLIAQEDNLEANPDLYRRFVAASLRGWDAARNDPEGSVDALLEIFPGAGERDRMILYVKQVVLPPLCVEGSSTLGSLPADRWDVTYDLLTTYSGLTTEQPIEHYYRAEFVAADAPACP